MDLSLEALEPEYRGRLSAMKLLKPVAAKQTATRLLQHRDRFLGAQQLCGVPALWIMATFEREGPSFDAYFGNGDPLNQKTKHVPAGRGPFSTWEEGVADALHLDHVASCPEWNWLSACWEWEKWNGFGPRQYHGRPTGYLWAGTDQYQGGKYGSDGVWSRGTWDQQLGTVIVAKAIADLDPEIGKEFPPL
jgi:lysozyme family protein